MNEKQDTNHTREGVILILLSSVMFGSYGVWSKLIGSSFGVFYQGWVRALLISLALFPILLFTKKIVSFERNDRKWLAIFLIFTSFTTAPIYYAFTHMDLSAAYLLFFVGVILTMYIVGFTLFREKITKIKLIALITACLGLYAVFSFSADTFTPLAACMAFLNGIASGCEIAFSKKLSGSYSPLYLSWLSWIAILVTNGIMSLAAGEIQHVPSFDIAWFYLVAYATTGIIGFWFVVNGVQYLESSIGSLLTPLEVVFGILFGIVIFNESLTFRVVLGGLLIIVAAILPHLHKIISSGRVPTASLR